MVSSGRPASVAGEMHEPAVGAASASCSVCSVSSGSGAASLVVGEGAAEVLSVVLGGGLGGRRGRRRQLGLGRVTVVAGAAGGQRDQGEHAGGDGGQDAGAVCGVLGFPVFRLRVCGVFYGRVSCGDSECGRSARGWVRARRDAR